MKKMMNEFKVFITRGNVIDLAVGVIIGGAFTSIVTSLVNDVVMPIVGVILQGVSFTELKYVITPATEEVSEVAIYYGNFIQSLVIFIFTAFIVFVLVKTMNTFYKKKEVEKPVPTTPEDIKLLSEIRDLLKER